MKRTFGIGGGGLGRPRLVLAAALAQLALAGCYRYTPVEPAAAPAGSDVRIRVAPGVRLSVGSVPLAENGGRVVRGRLTRGPATDTLQSEVFLDAPLQGAGRGLRGTVSIPVGVVEELEVRSLDRLRTGGLVGVSALLAWVIVDNAFDIRSPEKPTDDSGNVDNARITVFRIRF